MTLILTTICLLITPLASTASEQAKAETEYFAIFFDGKKVGHGTHTRTAEPRQVTTTDTLAMTIKRAGVSLAVTSSETSVETPDGKPLRFESAQNLAAMAMKVTGVVNAQGKCDLAVTSSGVTQKQTIPWPKGAVMAEGLQLLLAKQDLKPGTTFSVRLFAPSMLQAVENEVRVGTTQNVDLLGRVVPLTEVVVSTKVLGSTVISKTYIDEKLNALKTIMPVMGMNIELISCDRQFALSDNDVYDFIDKIVMPSPAPLGDIASIKSVTYHLAPKGEAKLSLPAADTQTVRPDGQGGLLVTVKPVRLPKGIALPYSGRDKTALQALKPTRYLQSEHKAVVSLARRAVGDAKDAAEAARRIEKFVHDHIDEKNLSVGYAAAAEVAASRQGDCSEHAVLTAAMCQAVGIPARVALGQVFAANFPGKENVFVGHAWTEIFLGGKWIGLDATRAPNGFSPGHITLATGNGNPEDFFNLLDSLGQFTITGVEVRN